MMRTKRALAILAIGLSGLAGCAPVPVEQPQPRPQTAPAPTRGPVARRPMPAGPAHDPKTVAQRFVGVMQRMEPAVERECRTRRTQPINCDFQFVVDSRPGQPLNAFQTVDKTGRPLIGFTLSLIAATRNPDELAFVVGHEASHHILNHLDKKAGAATAGAIILGGLASVASRGDAGAIRQAQQIGANFGARYYSKEWELQADYLGAILTLNAGYDARLGAQFFQRIPDPGNHILGTHPARADRIAQVDRAAADLRAGRAR